MQELSTITTDRLSLPELVQKNCRAAVLRLDKIHPVVSGNKWFKLKYYLEEATKARAETLLTFGGAYSNHIVAAAYAAKEAGFRSAGVIRGERPRRLSPTLEAAIAYGMQLFFVSRPAFKNKEQAGEVQALLRRLSNCYLIPEGGAGEPGIKGCKEILPLADNHNTYSHILCASGTGTMGIGLARSAAPHQQVISVPVLKGMDSPAGEYHFGGYAKKTPELLAFMNNFYERTGIPTDFVYTGKLVYAFTDLLRNGFIKPGSNILLIHSGGLQGNASLPEGALHY
ncbi:MAG TPA: pyridoxal-phosphate dependent enzyme [Chitinophagaceae bacterium]|nr:pyridoxal-phosphate dependent enzyme [Chitinophagaceae bacterium]